MGVGLLIIMIIAACTKVQIKRHFVGWTSSGAIGVLFKNLILRMSSEFGSAFQAGTYSGAPSLSRNTTHSTLVLVRILRVIYAGASDQGLSLLHA